MHFFQNQLKGQNTIVTYFPWILMPLIVIITLKINSEVDDTQEGRGIDCEPREVPKIGC